MLEEFPDDEPLARWIAHAPERIAFQGLPGADLLARVRRARAGSGCASTRWSRSGELKAPIVIGRDHLDSGSVASPYRETEGMADGSDAIADWPLLNALVNTAAGATLGVDPPRRRRRDRALDPRRAGVRRRRHRRSRREKLERVLTNDPGTGVIRHVDAGYDRAVAVAAERGVRIPMREDRDVRDRDRRRPGACGSGRRRSIADELRSPEIQRLIDDLIETRRAAGGAGLAATAGVGARADRGRRGRRDPRYPYKPPIPLTVLVNPEIEPLSDETAA